MTEEHYGAESLEKLTVPPPVNEFPGFYKIQIYYCVHNNKPLIHILARLIHSMSPLSHDSSTRHTALKKRNMASLIYFWYRCSLWFLWMYYSILTPHTFMQLYCRKFCRYWDILLTAVLRFTIKWTLMLMHLLEATLCKKMYPL